MTQTPLLLLSIFFLFSSPVAFSHPAVNLSDATDSAVVPVSAKESANARAIQEFGATDAEIQSAYCTAQEAPSLAVIEQYFASTDHGPLVSGPVTVNGLELRNLKTKDLQALQDLTTPKSLFGDVDSTRPVHLDQLAAKCTHPRCAIEAVFGPEIGLKLWYLYDRYGFNASHLVYNNSDAWTLEELDLLLVAIQDLPDSINAFRNKRLSRFSRGYTLAKYKDLNVIANATIMVFDPWDTQSAASKRYSILHEIHHNLGEPLESSKAWTDISGFSDSSRKGTLIHPEWMVSDYGASNPLEDIAESLSSYRYSPLNLKAISPQKYAYIQEHIFQGREFTSNASCSGWSDEARKQLLQEQVLSQVDWSQMARQILQAFESPDLFQLNDPVFANCPSVAEALIQPDSGTQNATTTSAVDCLAESMVEKQTKLILAKQDLQSWSEKIHQVVQDLHRKNPGTDSTLLINALHSDLSPLVAHSLHQALEKQDLKFLQEKASLALNRWRTEVNQLLTTSLKTEQEVWDCLMQKVPVFGVDSEVFEFILDRSNPSVRSELLQTAKNRASVFCKVIQSESEWEKLMKSKAPLLKSVATKRRAYLEKTLLSDPRFSAEIERKAGAAAIYNLGSIELSLVSGGYSHYSFSDILGFLRKRLKGEKALTACQTALAHLQAKDLTWFSHATPVQMGKIKERIIRACATSLPKVAGDKKLILNEVDFLKSLHSEFGF